MYQNETLLEGVIAYVKKASEVFLSLYESLKDIPLFGRYLATPFYWVYNFLDWVRYYLQKVDDALETIPIRTLIDHPGMWLLVQCGADIGRAEFFKDRPWEWFIWRFRKEHPILDALLERDFDWIWSYLRDRFPILAQIVRNPRGWVRDRIDELWPDFGQIRRSPGLWLLVKAGADIARASHFKRRPWAWFIWKFRKEHPPLDALLERDTRWLFRWVREAIDDYLDDHIEWLIETGGRVLNIIWTSKVGG